MVGAERTGLYIPMLLGKKVGLVANHSSRIGTVHLVDSLCSLGIDVQIIMSPEHGFRGTAEAGELVANSLDRKTGIPVISLYGSHKKPTPEDLKDIEVVVFDLQDVGARFYTYISTLHYVMEACAQQGVEVIVLDRPNPNGHYVDGPVLEPQWKSFVGMHPVPVVHGMTLGEYARMIQGEGWMENGIKGKLTVIPCSGYSHSTPYRVPLAPSPNLQSMKAIYLYPSLCFFEGTPFSVGRGTDIPFMIFGHPDLKQASFEFTPRSIQGASVNLPLSGRKCFGVDLSHRDEDSLRLIARLDLSWILFAYHNFPKKSEFFTPYFDTLAGTDKLRKQIEQGWSEEQIRAGWKPDLEKYLSMSKKYLLYDR